jgi:thioredoxin reductase
MSEAVDVAIVGAGPYGLSVAAHLRHAGMSYRQFGFPMSLWRAMPAGMFLKSQGFASNLSDPEGTHTLEAFCRKTGHPYQNYGLPVSLENFVNYGQWFADELVPGWEEIMVTDVARCPGGFAVTLADGETVQARNVVMAAGVEHFTRMPQQFAHLPESVASHISRYSDLTQFAGQRIVIVGAGQYALESAALLHEAGAEVQLAARAGNVIWNGELLEADRTLRQRLREPESGLGSGWSTWVYSRHPEWFRRLPERTRIHRARTALGPAGAHWLRRRVEDQFPVHTSTEVRSATAIPAAGGDATSREAVQVDLVTRGGGHTTIEADHVIAATGYMPDLSRLTFVDPTLRAQLSTVDGSPSVDSSYRTAVPGLFVIGPAVAPSFGPVMRFVYGSDHAANTVADALAGGTRTRTRPAVLAGV